MNCKQVQELLPLYVSRDLEQKRAQLVTAHVQSCAECTGSADEYRETRHLLQQFKPPLFSEGVYAGIRRHVLREIEREATAPGLSRLLESLFRPRLRWAVATALLLAVSVFAFYFIANRRPNLMDDRQQVAGSRRQVDRATQDEQPKAQHRGPESAASTSPSTQDNNGPPSKSTGRNNGGDMTIAASGAHQSQRRKSVGAAADRPTSVAGNAPETPPMIAEASRESNNLAAPDAVPARDPAASEKILRVEMQTKDPNIRIIWFSPQRPKQDSPSKSSKGI
jgi:hypothetical protein